MLKILGRIPCNHFYVACSGGSDSMVLVDFLRRYSKNKFDILHFNHKTEYCDEAEEFVREFCDKNKITCHVGTISRPRAKDESQEEYWRKERYKFFSKYSHEEILMSHHLKDCIETWVMTSLCGNPQLIPYRNEKYNIIRPLLTASKDDINEWIERNNIKYVYDKSNSDTSIKRNYVRHEMWEHILKVNPGIEKTIRRKIMEEFNKNNKH